MGNGGRFNSSQAAQQIGTQAQRSLTYSISDPEELPSEKLIGRQTSYDLLEEVKVFAHKSSGASRSVGRSTSPPDQEWLCR
jgi:hypothetical protein